jgi:hypothetical protein
VPAVNEAQKSIDSAARRVGISRLTHHDLRHLFATTLIEHGIIFLPARLGHKMEPRNAHMTPSDEYAQKVMARCYSTRHLTVPIQQPAQRPVGVAPQIAKHLSRKTAVRSPTTVNSRV